MRLSSQNFRQCKSTATQNYSPLAIRYSLPFYHSPLATRHSLLAAVLTFASRYSLPFFFRLADLPTSRLAENLARPSPHASFRSSSHNLRWGDGAMKCPVCQADLPNGAKFCPQCGARVGEVEEINPALLA
ncbi:zinc ribbon domain-containing protein, partial [Fervidibacter sp.]